MSTQSANSSSPLELNKPLSELVAGDWVIFQNRRSYSLRQISRTTNTQIVINTSNFAGGEYVRNFYKKNGWEVGSSSRYDTSLVKPFSNEMWLRILQDRRYQRVFERLPMVKSSDTDVVNECYNFLLAKGFIEPIETN